MWIMDFIRRIIGFFRKSEVSKDKLDRIVEIANSEKPIEIPEKPLEAPEKQANGKESEIIEKIQISETAEININKLELVKVEREAETIAAYSKLLVKNIGYYRNNKNEGDSEGISKKYKMIFTHSMELKNLLSAINEMFFEVVLGSLSAEKPERKEIEEEQKKVLEVNELLARIGLYDEQFNQEKTSDYRKNIEKEVDGGEFISKLEELTKMLNERVLNRKTGINAKINAIMQKVRF